MTTPKPRPGAVTGLGNSAVHTRVRREYVEAIKAAAPDGEPLVRSLDRVVAAGMKQLKILIDAG